VIHEQNPDSYFFKFWDVHDIDPLKVQAYERLEGELQSLDVESWRILKSESQNLCLQSNEDRGWSKFFEKLNEAKGYAYLKSEGFTNIEFIPRSKVYGVETPDLEAHSPKGRVFCEVKTINESDELIHARKNIIALEVKNFLPKGFKNKLESVLRKAAKQLRSHDINDESFKIIYLVISHDDGLYYESELNNEVYEHFKSLGFGNIECVIHDKTKI